MTVKKSFIIATLAVATGIPAFAAPAPAPQDWGRQSYGFQDDGHRDRDDSAAFRKGFRDGSKDVRKHRAARPERKDKYRERDDREAYSRGYWRGYNSIR